MSATTNAGTHSCGDPAEHEYTDLLDNIKRRIAAIDGPVFTTDAETVGSGLFQLFLTSLPANRRQHYTCHACRRFVQQFGGLVTIDDKGRTVPVMWVKSEAVDIMAAPVDALAGRVKRARVTGVFLSGERVWGTPVTGDWFHMSGTQMASLVFTHATLSAGQRMAELRQDYQTVSRGLAEFSAAHVGVALELLDGEDLYRSERIVGPARWLRGLHAARGNLRGKARENVTWSAVSTAPAGFCHVKSTMVGTLLEDIAAGMTFEQVSGRFASKMNPLKYQRPQALPKAGAVAEAERIVSKLCSAGSLDRRYARLDDLETVWTPTPERQPQKVGGAFGHIKTRDSQPEITRAFEGRPAKTMTWEKFAAEVLPIAGRIDIKVEVSPMSFYAFVTAADPDAPPILQWDNEDDRNPVSWYTLSGGSRSTAWNTEPGWRTVNAVSMFPFQWGSRGALFDRHTPGALFAIDGCRHMSNGTGLFPELMRGEYHSIRAVIEQYARQAGVAGREEASACGLVVRKGAPRGVRVRVLVDNVSREYHIDRWE